MLSTNIVGTVNLLEAASRSGFEAFVHAGSSSEYGVKDHSPTETDWLEPNSHYAVTKASAALFCRFAGQRDGLSVRVLRLYSVYGPWEEPNRLMPTLVLRGLAGELPPLVSAATARDYVFTDDAVDAFILAATAPNQEPGAIYNVGTGKQTSLEEVVTIAKRQLQINADPRWASMPARQWDTEVWIADPRRIDAALGWQPRHTVETGLQLLTSWIRDDPRIREFYETYTTIGV
jgi:dolichol-phosphate mannosyltransferase